MLQSKKILFAGLDNSGKTSIIKTFQRKFTFARTEPTLGLNRSEMPSTEILGYKFIAWDLGGQRKFRTNYFTRRDFIFPNTATLFYVIDIQDSPRFEESVAYLKHILDLFKVYYEFPELIILLHKFDSDLSQESSITSNSQYLQSIIKIQLKDVKKSIFKTSIYEISDLFKAISLGMVRLNPKADLINKFLRSYTQMTFSSAAVLLSHNLLLIGSHAKKSYYQKICEAVAPRFAIAMEKLDNYGIKSHKMVLDLSFNGLSSKLGLSKNQKALAFISPLSADVSDRLYLVTLSLNPKTMKLSLKFIPKLVKQLNFLMNLLLQ